MLTVWVTLASYIKWCTRADYHESPLSSGGGTFSHAVRTSTRRMRRPFFRMRKRASHMRNIMALMRNVDRRM